MAVGFTACDFSDENAKSAYEIAVENGFTGTEAEWLNSLRGANGSDGSDLDINDVYDAAVQNGYEGTFLEFLKEYLSADISENNDTETIAHNMMSVVSVYCGFTVTGDDRRRIFRRRADGGRGRVLGRAAASSSA